MRDFAVFAYEHSCVYIDWQKRVAKCVSLLRDRLLEGCCRVGRIGSALYLLFFILTQ